MQGGGLGIADRLHGLTCDAVLDVEIVTADGQLLHCNERQHADLFWALRGGGGGQFGVITQLDHAHLQNWHQCEITSAVIR